MKNVIKFGVMCKGNELPKWQAECIKKLVALPGVELSLLIIDAGVSNIENVVSVKKSKLRKIFSKIRAVIYEVFFEHYLFKIYNRKLKLKAMEKVNMNNIFSNVSRMNCSVIKKGKFSEYFSSEDTGKISELDLDFILRFTFGIIKGDILKIPRYGVWSFHHDDEQVIRGGPPCFWEIYHGHHTTGAILQRLTDDLDAGIILKKGIFKTIKESYADNLDNALHQSAEWPRQVCMDIKNGAAEYLNDEPGSTSAPIYYAPNNFQLIFFFFIIFRNRISKSINSVIKKKKYGTLE